MILLANFNLFNPSEVYLKPIRPLRWSFFAKIVKGTTACTKNVHFVINEMHTYKQMALPWVHH